MELPKNVTQIGESDKGCKIYVEDYVISYIKQLNQLARNKDMAVALYGTRRHEKDITYIFIYGACKLDFIQREIRHLSQAQRQEIERLRRKHFAELEFQGYRLLNGEMVEGFHIYEQDICRYVGGYAQFYEKNEAMLGLMLASRAEEALPEIVSLEKYDTAKKHQEERREEHREEHRASAGQRLARERKAAVVKETSPQQISRQGIWRMRVATATVFALLCLTGIALLWDGQNAEKLQAAASRVLAELTEQKLPDSEDGGGTDMQTSTLIVDGSLTEAMQEENTETLPVTAIPSTVPSEIPTETITPAITASPEATATQSPTLAPTAMPTSVPTATPMPVSYTIQSGDTLIAISINRFGSDARVQELCALNDISDPDDIKIGQIILLPVQ